MSLGQQARKQVFCLDGLPSEGRVVIGVPSRDEAATIGEVAAMAVAGARVAGVADRTILINADNGSVDGSPDLFSAAADGLPHLLLATAGVGGGKGANVLAILRAAVRLDAEYVVLLDADVRSIEPSWVGLLLAVVRGTEPAIAVPLYRRNRFEGNTTNHLISPMMGSVLGVWVQQPLAGDFALNRGFLRRALTWRVSGSAVLYGIDVHLTAHAAREGLALRQVRLGRKLHNPGFPKILYGSQQVVDSFFQTIAGLSACTPAAPVPDGYETADDVATRPGDALVAQTVAKALRYLRGHDQEITEMFPSLARATPTSWGLWLDGRLWAQVLAEALQAVADGSAVPARDHLVALYLSRVMSYWREIEHLQPNAIDVLLQEQARSVCEQVSARRLSFAAVRPPHRFDPGYWERTA